MTEAELYPLLVRYADGTLNQEGLARLEAELAASATARALMQELAEQVFAIGEAGRCREVRTPTRRMMEAPAAARPWFRSRVLAGLAAAAVLIGFFAVLHLRSRGAVLEVVGLHGDAAWQDGQKRMPLVVGMRLPAGTIETESESATTEVGLADGTHFTLHGSAKATFGGDDGKQVKLERGKVTAFVAKQATGRSLSVQTPAADLEVLGTVFSLEAAPQQTSLSVSHGRVRLRRLVDGREVEVGAEQYVAASLVSTEALVAQEMKIPPSAWTVSFDTAPERSTGRWYAAAGANPAHLAAVPVVEARREDGSILVHHSIIVRSPPNSAADSFATLTGESILRIRLRMNMSFTLQLMITTRRADGAFAGNFELVKLHPEIIPGLEWQTLEVPFRDFLSNPRGRVELPAGTQANAVIISSMHLPVGLEVAEMAILPNASAP